MLPSTVTLPCFTHGKCGSKVFSCALSPGTKTYLCCNMCWLLAEIAFAPGPSSQECCQFLYTHVEKMFQMTMLPLPIRPLLLLFWHRPPGDALHVWR